MLTHSYIEYCLFLQVDACSLAQETALPVQHPLLDRVRQCSSNPEQAALFFQQILNPVPHVRRQAIHHAWCAETVNIMFRQTRTDYPPDDADPLYYFDFGLYTSCMGTACAALAGCFTCGGCNQPSVHRSQSKQVEAETRSSLNSGSKGPVMRVKSSLQKMKSTWSKLKPAFVKQPKCGTTGPAPVASAVS